MRAEARHNRKVYLAIAIATIWLLFAAPFFVYGEPLLGWVFVGMAIITGIIGAVRLSQSAP